MWEARQAACYLRVLEEVLSQAWHRIERYAITGSKPTMPS
jgi:hypothetical protein